MYTSIYKTANKESTPFIEFSQRVYNQRKLRKPNSFQLSTFYTHQIEDGKHPLSGTRFWAQLVKQMQSVSFFNLPINFLREKECILHAWPPGLSILLTACLNTPIWEQSCPPCHWVLADFQLVQNLLGQHLSSEAINGFLYFNQWKGNMCVKVSFKDE